MKGGRHGCDCGCARRRGGLAQAAPRWVAVVRSAARRRTDAIAPNRAGDTSYACGYLALGNRTAADAQLEIAFDHLAPPFNVFTERSYKTSNGGTQHFITGSGGLLQAFVFGYSGLRINRRGVLSFTAAQPVLPPLGVTRVTLRGLHLLGTAFDFAWDGAEVCTALQPGGGGGGAALELRVVGSGAVLPLTAAQACVAVGPVEVAGVGFD